MINYHRYISFMAELLNIMILNFFTKQINKQTFEIEQKIAPSLWGQKIYR